MVDCRPKKYRKKDKYQPNPSLCDSKCCYWKMCSREQSRGVIWIRKRKRESQSREAMPDKEKIEQEFEDLKKEKEYADY